jgi:O-antigen/teichoic acid export membrane protein
VTTIGARGISLIASFFFVPVVARSLDSGELGLWLNLTTAFAMFVVLDFGVGPAVMGQVSAARGNNDFLAMRQVVSTAFVLLSGIALVLVFISGILVYTIDWSSVLGMRGEASGALVRQLLLALAVTGSLSLPLTIAGRVYHALQRGHVVAFNTAIGVVLQAVGIFWVAASAPDLRWFFAVYLLTSLATGMMTTVLLLGRSARDLRPRVRYIDRCTIGQLGRESAQLFLLSVIAVIAYKTDAFIIGHYLGMSRVPDYVLALNLFALVPAFVSMFLTPLWAAYREAQTRGDQAWVRRAYVRSVVLATAVGALAAGVMVAVTPLFLRAWVGDEVAPPSVGLLWALACYVVVMCTSTAIGVFLNGLGMFRLQLRLALIMAVLNVAASIWLVRRIGLVGPVWATVITQTCVVLVPCMIYARRRLVPRETVAVMT